MKKRMLGLTLLVWGMLSVARDASADEHVDPDAILGVVGFGALAVWRKVQADRAELDLWTEATTSDS